ncbi:hypothetical protein, partial [Serratia marcescens]|uniref:hypothetical protein n=1 Tax=Serratia marcescens TaxID=615 RepID=UPI00320612F8
LLQQRPAGRASTMRVILSRRPPFEKPAFKAGFFSPVVYEDEYTSADMAGLALWRASICRPREIYLSFTLN